MASSGLNTNASVAKAETEPRIIAEREPLSARANSNAGATQPMIATRKAGDRARVSASAAAARGNTAYSKPPKWFALAKKPTRPADVGDSVEVKPAPIAAEHLKHGQHRAGDTYRYRKKQQTPSRPPLKA